MSLTLTLKLHEDRDEASRDININIGEYTLEETNNSSRDDIRLIIVKRNSSERIIGNVVGERFYIEYSSRTGKLKLMVGKSPSLFVKTDGLYLFKDIEKKLNGYWDVLIGEYLIGMNTKTRTLFVLDIFYQNEYTYCLNELKFFNFTDLSFSSFDKIKYTFQWNHTKNRIDFYIIFNSKMIKLVLDLKKREWFIKEKIKLRLNKIVDIHISNDNLIIFTKKGIYDYQSNLWIMTTPDDYILTKIFKTVNSHQIWINLEYKNKNFGLKQIYIYNTIGSYYHGIKLNVDLFDFHALFFRHQWVCRFETPISPPVWTTETELYNKKSFNIPLISAKPTLNHIYNEHKDCIEYKEKQIKYILYERVGIQSSVFVFLTTPHLKEIKYKDELFENKEANDKMIYPTYVFTKPEWLINIVEHFRIMIQLKHNQIIMELPTSISISTLTLNKKTDKLLKRLTESVDYFLLPDEIGTVCEYNPKLDELTPVYTMKDKKMKYNALLDIFTMKTI